MTHFDTMAQVTKAVDDGEHVCWKTSAYAVRLEEPMDGPSRYVIAYTSTGVSTPVFDQDGTCIWTPDEFFINGGAA